MKCLHIVAILLAAVFLFPQSVVGMETTAAHYERPSQSAGPYKDSVIVFVHGLSGDADSTWRYSPTVYWPRLLLADDAFSDADVYVASYSTSLLGDTNISEIVTNLETEFAADQVFEKHNKVAFVCHSLGGLIVKQFLLTYRQHAPKVSFVYFFSTPQTGSQLASLATVFNSNPLLRELSSADNDYLEALENQWTAAHFHIRRFCAFEKKKYKGVLVVDRLSSTRSCDEVPLAIGENHATIVKPDSVKHLSYVAFRNAFKESISVPVVSTAHPAPLPQRSVFQPSPPMFREAHDEFNVSAGTLSTTLRKGQLSQTCLADMGGTCLVSASVGKDGVLLIDAVIVNRPGLGEVTLKKNELHENIPEWDRCYDDTTLELVNGQLTPTLQVIYKTPNEVLIYGVFLIEDTVYMLSPSGFSWHSADQPVTSDEYSVKRIFKYPSRATLCKEKETASAPEPNLPTSRPYSSLTDKQLCDAVVEEASKTYYLANQCLGALEASATRREPDAARNTIRRQFSDQFMNCCWQTVTDMHDELKFRLKPTVAGEGERYFDEVLWEYHHNPSGVVLSAVEDVSTDLRDLCGQLEKHK